MNWRHAHLQFCKQNKEKTTSWIQLEVIMKENDKHEARTVYGQKRLTQIED